MRSIMLVLIAAAFTFSPTIAPTSEEQIHSVRRQVDDAFQRHDAKQLAALTTSDVHFTAPSVHVDGADALERLYTGLFARRPDVVLTHQINRMVINENWDLASEWGDWLERWTYKDGVTEIRGTYLTMWKREGGYWRVYSETIVPESCAGSSYCQEK